MELIFILLLLAFLAATGRFLQNIFKRRPAAERALRALRSLGFMLLVVTLFAAFMAPSQSNRAAGATLARTGAVCGALGLALIIVCTVFLFVRRRRLAAAAEAPKS